MLVSDDPGEHAQWLHDLVTVGFDEVYLHHAEALEAVGLRE